MALNKDILKQFNVQHYAGPISEMPSKLPFGDFYFAEDVAILYKYNYLGLPISIGGVGGGATYTRATTYSTLTDGESVGDLAYVDSSEGTAWLPSTLGGSYYPSGWYLWNGSLWVSDKNSIANQFETNINSLNTKVDIVTGKGLSTNDLTNAIATQITDSASWISTNATNLIDHTTDTNNPHSVTKAQVGLGNADNTSDLNKPLSTAMSNALSSKVDVVAGERLITSAEAIKLGNQAGINTGDQDISLVGLQLSLSSGSTVTLTDTNTQLSDADITAFGYVKTDNDTQLTDAEIAAFGYVKTDNDTTYTNVSEFVNDSLYLVQSEVEALITIGIAEGDFYKELTYVTGDLSKIETYEDATKATKLFTKDFTYTTGSLTQIVLTDEIESTTETKTLSYDGSGNLISITKT